MPSDPILETTIATLRRRTGRSRLEVLAVLGDRLARLRPNPEDTAEIAVRAEAMANVTAAIDAELLRGIGGR